MERHDLVANWFGPDTIQVRLVPILVILASLLMAVAIPAGFGDRTLLFACSCAALQSCTADWPPGVRLWNFFAASARPRATLEREQATAGGGSLPHLAAR